MSGAVSGSVTREQAGPLICHPVSREVQVQASGMSLSQHL